MAIFAHPDDESAVGGTLARYAKQGVEVRLVCATRGEVGEISDASLATQGTLGSVRQMELEAACDVLGIGTPRFLAWRDSGMEGSSENEDPRALIQADPKAVIEAMVAHMAMFQPNVVITFEPFGWYGHPDHQAVSRLATAAFQKLYHTTSSGAWRPGALFYAVVKLSNFESVINDAIEQGYIDKPPFEQFPVEAAQQAETAVTHSIGVTDLFEIKEKAIRVHKTQFGEDNFFRKIPGDMKRRIWDTEHFIQVLPEPAKTLAERPNDLFRLL